jgi:hypothetical protein
LPENFNIRVIGPSFNINDEKSSLVPHKDLAKISSYSSDPISKTSYHEMMSEAL